MQTGASDAPQTEVSDNEHRAADRGRGILPACQRAAGSRIRAGRHPAGQCPRGGRQSRTRAGLRRRLHRAFQQGREFQLHRAEDLLRRGCESVSSRCSARASSPSRWCAAAMSAGRSSISCAAAPARRRGSRRSAPPRPDGRRRRPRRLPRRPRLPAPARNRLRLGCGTGPGSNAAPQRLRRRVEGEGRGSHGGTTHPVRQDLGQSSRPRGREQGGDPLYRPASDA